jgi:hypothetical protein
MNMRFDGSWRVLILLCVLIVTVVGLERTIVYQKYKPKPGIRLDVFLNQWNGNVASISRATGEELIPCYTVVSFRHPRSLFDLRSGPPKYFFGEDGDLVGWVLDSGD